MIITKYYDVQDKIDFSTRNSKESGRVKAPDDRRQHAWRLLVQGEQNDEG
jgi:hypothetical protein